MYVLIFYYHKGKNGRFCQERGSRQLSTCMNDYRNCDVLLLCLQLSAGNDHKGGIKWYQSRRLFLGRYNNIQ